jgi:LemA protein
VVLNLIFYATAALAAAGALLYVVGLYNQMVGSAREVERSFANVEVSLKQRHDEIPRLVELCRGYMQHEKDLLERITVARGRFEGSRDLNGKVAAENDLAPNLSRLFSLSEAYPELRANELFRRIADRLTGMENEIADRRELFNASATAYNTYIQVLPQRFVAAAAGFRPRLLLELR